jgi:hypothetical protein
MTIRTCAIIGGVLTVAGLVDSMIFSSRKRLAGANGAEGFGSREGKMVSVATYGQSIQVAIPLTCDSLDVKRGKGRASVGSRARKGASYCYVDVTRHFLFCHVIF